MALTDNLISFWELEEASGTRVDSVTATGNDLTDNNTVLSATGKVGNAADFELANSEYLSRADNASVSMGDIDFTITAWVNMESKTEQHPIVSHYDATRDQRAYQLRYRDEIDRFDFFVDPVGTGSLAARVAADNLGSPSVATWYFVVAWHDATADTINIQVNDGTVNSAAHLTGVLDSTSAFQIGAQSAPSDFWDGLIDQVGLWKRVLTAGERTQLYNSGNGLSYAQMQARRIKDVIYAGVLPKKR